MKYKGLIVSAVVLAGIGGISAFAASGHRGMGFEGGPGWHEGGHRGGWHQGGRRGHGMGLKRLDSDNDGDVTLDEFVKTRSDKFAALDKNGDGTLEGEELTSGMDQSTGQRTRVMMARLDTDGDGKITDAEFEANAGKGWRGRHGGRHGGHHGMHRSGRHGMGDMRTMDDESGLQGKSEVDVKPGSQDTAGEQDKSVDPAVRRKERFASLDANGDGVITSADLEAKSAERVGYFKKKMLHVLDKDGDGKVTRDEYLARSKQRFADMDLDGDGKITAADLPPGRAQRWLKGSDKR
ncbi:MAG: EF-hand domain-containing protein [Hyphomicrobiaceae bacterium]|nr:EF-hand domain-containing protein [Hyphomicrobiaceae bacterium]